MFYLLVTKCLTPFLLKFSDNKQEEVKIMFKIIPTVVT